MNTDIENLNKKINRYKWYLEEIRFQELHNLDIDYDEFSISFGKKNLV